MRNANEKAGTDRKSYRAVLLLLVAMAALSSAMRDLNRFQEFTHQIEELALSWSDSNLFAASAAGVTSAEKSCEVKLESNQSQRDFRWSGIIDIGKTIEIKGISGDINADGIQGGPVEVVAIKRARNGAVDRVSVKVVEHARGVTICAVYPTDDPNQTTACEPGDGNNQSSKSFNVRSGNVSVDFRVKVPPGVEFAGRTVNGGIVVNSLASNVECRTVNGSIAIATSGYASAKTVNGEISAKIGNSDWPNSLEFKTVNGEINLDLPALVSTSVKASTFNGEVSSDFPLTVLGRFSRKELNGTIGGGSGGRELILKTLNGSINLRRAN